MAINNPSQYDCDKMKPRRYNLCYKKKFFI